MVKKDEYKGTKKSRLIFGTTATIKRKTQANLHPCCTVFTQLNMYHHKILPLEIIMLLYANLFTTIPVHISLKQKS
jgi:hypothetical protein